MIEVAKFFNKDPDAPKPNRPNHIGTSILIEVDNKILMEQRTDSDTWAIIGGGLKINESLQECAIREVFYERRTERVGNCENTCSDSRGLFERKIRDSELH